MTDGFLKKHQVIIAVGQALNQLPPDAIAAFAGRTDTITIRAGDTIYRAALSLVYLDDATKESS